MPQCYTHRELRKSVVIKGNTQIYHFTSYELSISKVLLFPVHTYTRTHIHTYTTSNMNVYSSLVENCEKWPTPIQMLYALWLSIKRRTEKKKLKKKQSKNENNTNKVKHVLLTVALSYIYIHTRKHIPFHFISYFFFNKTWISHIDLFGIVKSSKALHLCILVLHIKLC